MKSKKLKYIKWIFILIFIISIIFDFYVVFKNENLLEVIKMPSKDLMLSLGILSIGILFVNFIKFILVFGIYYAIKRADRKVMKEKLSTVDVQKYDGYFRYILEGYTPAELSYIDDFNLSYPKDYVAMILNLKHKGIIDLDEKNNKILILKNNLQISYSEKLILDNIINGKLKPISDYNFSMMVQKDALNNKLLKSSLKPINFLNIFLKIFGIVFAFIFFFNIFLPKFDLINPYVSITILIVFILFFLYIWCSIFFLPIYGIAYLFKKAKNPFVRTDNGEEVNVRLEGLKNYLNDFSLIDKRNLPELIIWEDYLIYSVIFNQNIDLIKEISDKYFE